MTAGLFGFGMLLIGVSIPLSFYQVAAPDYLNGVYIGLTTTYPYQFSSAVIFAVGIIATITGLRIISKPSEDNKDEIQKKS